MNSITINLEKKISEMVTDKVDVITDTYKFLSKYNILVPANWTTIEGNVVVKPKNGYEYNSQKVIIDNQKVAKIHYLPCYFAKGIVDSQGFLTDYSGLNVHTSSGVTMRPYADLVPWATELIPENVTKTAISTNVLYTSSLSGKNNFLIDNEKMSGISTLFGLGVSGHGWKVPTQIKNFIVHGDHSITFNIPEGNTDAEFFYNPIEFTDETGKLYKPNALPLNTLIMVCVFGMNNSSYITYSNDIRGGIMYYLTEEPLTEDMIIKEV